MHLEEFTVTCDASHDSCGVVTLQMNSKCHFLSIAHYLSNHFCFFCFFHFSLFVSLIGDFLFYTFATLSKLKMVFSLLFHEKRRDLHRHADPKDIEKWLKKTNEWIWLSTTVTNTKHRSQIKMIITAKVYLNACAFMCVFVWKCSTMSPTRKTKTRYNALKHKHT